MLRVGLRVEIFRCAGILLLQWQGETLRIDNIWSFATFNLYNVQAKILYLQRYSTDFWNLCLNSKMLRVGIWVESFKRTGILLLQWQGENLAHRQHLKFCDFQPVHSSGRNPISPKVFNQFSRSSPQLEDVERGHLGRNFQLRRYFSFAMARSILCASTTFETLPLSTCTLCQHKSYISKGIQPIFEIFPSARRCWMWTFGWKVSGAQVFYFCNGKVKTWRIDNIWNFATINLYTVPAKILYLQRYSSDFRNLSVSSKMLKVGIWVESFRCAGILLLQWQGEILRIDTIWNFATFNLYTVPAKILYLQRYSSDFRNLSVSSKMLKVGIWVESFRCAGILLLQWRGENFAHQQNFKFWHFQPVHCASRNPISPKVFNWFSKSLPQLEDVDCGHLGGKFQVRTYFIFAMARWKLCASTTFEIFALSTCTLCKQKILYLQRYSTNFRNLRLSSKMLTVAIWVESFRCARVFAFAMARWKLGVSTTFEIFATFILYTVPAKILYLQKYSTDFRNLSVSSKMLRVAIWVESFKCAGILLLQWQGENFAHRQHLKLCYFQPVHCASRNPISPKVFNRFSKSLPQLEEVDGGHLGGKIQVPWNFTFAMAR